MQTSGKRNRNKFLGLLVMMLVCGGMLFAQPITVTLPASSLLPNSSVSIPLVVSSTTGRSITSFEFIITCDTTIMTFDGVDQTGTLSANTWNVLSNSSVNGYGPGRMRVVAASSGPLVGSGVLVYIKGTTKSKAGSSTLQFEGTSFIFNTGASTDPQPSITPGTVRVNRPPTINPVSAKTAAQGDSLSFNASATDLDLPNDTLRYSLSNAPAGAAIEASTGAFGWRPSFSQLGPFSVVVKVRDTGGMSDSTIVSITVTKTNVKPTFINKMRDTTVNQGQTLSFTYTASDPNADPVTYTLLATPTGAAITAGGVFTWRPLYPLVGPTVISVIVSDGLAQDIASATVTVSRINQKPVINSKVPGAVPTVSANKPTVFALNATDPNGDPLTYRWVVNNQVVKSGTDSSYTTTFTDPHNTAKFIWGVCTDPEGLADSTFWAFTITDVANVSVVPTEYSLGQNYPNPFNPTTTLQFDLPKTSVVTLEVFNVSGSRVRSLLKGENLGSGRHSMVWNGQDDKGRFVPSGVYVYRITAGDFHAWKKMTLLK